MRTDAEQVRATSCSCNAAYTSAALFMTFSGAVHLVRQVLVRYSRDDVATLPTSWVDVDDIYARAHLTLERRSTVYIVR